MYFGELRKDFWGRSLYTGSIYIPAVCLNALLYLHEYKEFTMKYRYKYISRSTETPKAKSNSVGAESHPINLSA